MSAKGHLQKWPFVPTNPVAWAHVKEVWPAEDGLGFVGHDRTRFFFQRRGDKTPLAVQMSVNAIALLLKE